MSWPEGSAGVAPERGAAGWAAFAAIAARRFAVLVEPSLLETVRLSARIPAASPPVADLRGTLAPMLDRLRRAWAVAVVRRALLCGLVPGIVVAGVATWRNWPGWLGPVCAALFAAALVVRAWPGAPSMDGAARFLDRELECREQIATALELEAAGSSRPSPLAARVREGGLAAARDATARWSPSGVPARREWVALVLLCAALAVAAIPSGGIASTTVVAPASALATPVDAAPTVPTSRESGPALAVQITVVSNEPVSTPARTGPVAQRLSPHPTARRGQSLRRPATPRPGAARSGGSGHAATSGVGRRVAATSSQRTVPLINPSESLLPTTPATPGQHGTLYGRGRPRQGATRGGSQSGGAGASSRGASGAARAGMATKGSGSTGQRAGGKGGSPGGKAAASGGRANQCLYVCSRINPSQLTAPGLITGKGQFTGRGIPGGKTAGHGLGAAPHLGSGATPRVSTAAHQLAITSAYGPSSAAGRSSRQVPGHNGAGGAQQSPVTAAAGGSQATDYVAPDANVVLPGDSALVGRYFTAHRVS